MNRIGVILILLVAVGCAARRESVSVPVVKKSTPQDPLVGDWTGEYPKSAEQADSGTTSNYLAEHLGGYALSLDSQGQFKASLRGLDEVGTWSKSGDTVVLKVVKVLGKSRSEADKENRDKGRSFIDLTLFDQPVQLTFDANKATLTWAGPKGSPPVVFHPGSGR